jgi:hypothetical protein
MGELTVPATGSVNAAVTLTAVGSTAEPAVPLFGLGSTMPLVMAGSVRSRLNVKVCGGPHRPNVS